MKSVAEVAHGPMLVGFTLNACLYGIMITQVYMYFTSSNKDKTWMKCFVLFLLVADTVNTVFDFLYLYKSLIVNFGDGAFLAKADWLFATDPALTGIIASLVQLFYAWRVRVLTRSWLFLGLVFICAISGGVAAIVTAFEVGRIPNFVDFRHFKAVVIIWLAAESVGDLLITSILVWYLISRRKHKTGFKSSDLMIDRIIRLTVQTGLITSLVATLDLIFFLYDPAGTHLIFNFPLCKLYTNSLMSSLNARSGWRFFSQSRDVTAMDSDGFAIEFCSPPIAASDMGFGQTSTSRLMKPLDVFHSRAISRPEIFVHVESHQVRDADTSTTRTHGTQMPVTQNAVPETQVGKQASLRTDGGISMVVDGRI
ncbi:hypothetical protein K443DRAFT_481095 [Laccaria amethystina LaAM-08-1]|uniref:DUF6534 domain-containing protein n=1 Tax=Laccaria amethystina LaAM-08-1 TaxID=1095629 RepID=A0A0C9Y058_9AGAR|nr:hypothetical protein K443DRAFT_481095 [Laccaria amethystina LaAM-08-1]